MRTTTIDPEHHTSLYSDLLNAMGFLRHGVFGIASLDGSHSFRYFPLLMTSQGCERLAKVTLMVDRYDREGVWPSFNRLKKWGHGLPRLRENCEKVFSRTDYLARCSAAADDLKFLQSDPWFHRLFEILGDFGYDGRYDNLSAVVDPSKVVECEERFSELRYDILMADGRINAGNLVDPGTQRLQYEIMNGTMISSVQRFARALARLFTLGPLRQLGVSLSPALQAVSSLRDHQLHLPWGEELPEAFDAAHFVAASPKASTPTPPNIPRAVRLVRASWTAPVRQDLGVKTALLNGGVAVLVGNWGAYWVADCAVFAGNGTALGWSDGIGRAPVGINMDTISAAVESV